MPHVYATSIAPIAAFQAEFLQDLCQQNRESRQGMLLYVDMPGNSLPDLTGLEANSELLSPECVGLLEVGPDAVSVPILARLFENMASAAAPDVLIADLVIRESSNFMKGKGVHSYCLGINAEPLQGKAMLSMEFTTSRKPQGDGTHWNGDHYLKVLTAARQGFWAARPFAAGSG